MPGIRDVARHARVAASTVSRVLNGRACVSDETRRRIEEAIRELNYVPNELARGMFLRRAGTVAMLVPSIRHPLFAELAAAMERELYFHGYKLIICSTDGELRKEREYLNTFKSNIVDGLIIGAANLTPAEYESFGRPLVMLDYRVNERIPIVVSDHVLGGRLAAEEFLRSGCKHVMHIVDEPDARVESQQCHDELDRLLNDAGVETQRLAIKWNNQISFGDYCDTAWSFLERYPETDGVMGSDIQALAFLKTAMRMGRHAGSDFSVIAYDGTYVVDMEIISVIAVVQNVSVIGQRVLGTLFDLIESGSTAEPYSRIPVELRPGETTCKRGIAAL